MNDLSHDLAAIEGALQGQDEAIFVSWKRLKDLLTLAHTGVYPPYGQEGVGGNVSYLAWYLHKMALTGKKPLPNSEGFEWLLFRYVKATEEVTQLIQEVVRGSHE